MELTRIVKALDKLTPDQRRVRVPLLENYENYRVMNLKLRMTIYAGGL